MGVERPRGVRPVVNDGKLMQLRRPAVMWTCLIEPERSVVIDDLMKEVSTLEAT